MSGSWMQQRRERIQSTPPQHLEVSLMWRRGSRMLLLELEQDDETRRQFALEWVRDSFWPLALTKRGCRIVQKAVDVGSPAYQQQLVEQLRGKVVEALKSPHTNYVLQKFIETMPPERMQFVVTELKGE